ncbi:MAG: metallophosphoesterase [Treponema sp.]|jgi:3',5'-cyclic AMP phosphodiesterase CpdA|nr:metallophosphoesterase [Treponema sp.]
MDLLKRGRAAVCLLLLSCNADLGGFFASTDLDERLAARDTFVFLSGDDLRLTLPDEYTFILISDTHITADDTKGLERIESQLIESDRFIVVTGDITDTGSEAELRAFLEIFGSLPIPCFPVIGNHDLFFGNWSVWRKLIGSATYRAGSADSSTDIIVLDSASAFFGASQLEWLRGQLRGSKRHTLIFTHCPLYLDGTLKYEQITDWKDPLERAKFMAIAAGSCEAFFAGHIHIRTDVSLGGLRFVTIEDYSAGRAFARVSVDHSGLHWQFLRL